MTPRKALILLIFASTTVRLAWAATLGPGNDEAYFLQYAQNPDWSYFDHPPMVAWMAWLGSNFAPWLGTTFAIRLPFALLFAATTLLMARFASRLFGARAGVLAALVLNVAGYFPLAAGSFALPDGPLIFFWIATLDRFHAAVQTPSTRKHSLLPWVFVGACWGCALLSKYHALLLPLGLALFLVAEPRGRAWLQHPGPYLALAVGALLFAPVLGWNAAHGWSSFAFQGGRAVVDQLLPRPDRLATALLGQVAYAFPWIWLALIATALRVAWRGRNSGTSQSERLLLIQSLVPLAAFLAVGSWRSLLPHWSLVALVPLFPLLGSQLAQNTRSTKRESLRWLAWAIAPLLVASAIVAHSNWGIFQREGDALLAILPPARDPSLDVYGWRELADALRNDPRIKPTDRYLFTSKWYHSSQIALALDTDLPVLCYSARAPLGYADWSRPEQWVGQDGILAVVNHSSTEPAAYDRWFERIDSLGTISIQRAGAVVKSVRLYRCVRQTQPFPFLPLRQPIRDHRESRIAQHTANPNSFEQAVRR